MSYKHHITITDTNAPEWTAAWECLLKRDIPAIINYYAGLGISLQDGFIFNRSTASTPSPNTDKFSNHHHHHHQQQGYYCDTDYHPPHSALPGPIVDPANGGTISLNGVGNAGHTPLLVSTQHAQIWAVDTAGKPYDVVVCCIMLRAYMLNPGNVRVVSDGEWGIEWMRVVKGYQALWPGHWLMCPWDGTYERVLEGWKYEVKAWRGIRERVERFVMEKRTAYEEDDCQGQFAAQGRRQNEVQVQIQGQSEAEPGTEVEIKETGTKTGTKKGNGSWFSMFRDIVLTD